MIEFNPDLSIESFEGTRKPNSPFIKVINATIKDEHGKTHTQQLRELPDISSADSPLQRYRFENGECIPFATPDSATAYPVAAPQTNVTPPAYMPIPCIAHDNGFAPSVIQPFTVSLFQDCINRRGEDFIEALKNLDNQKYQAMELAKIITLEMRLVVNCGRWLYIHNGHCYEKCSDSMLVRYIRQLCDYAGLGFLAGFLNLICKEISQLLLECTMPEQAENLIVFENCVLHLPTMSCCSHSPDIFLTSKIRCSWNPIEEPTPEFDKLLQQCFGDDETLKMRLMEILGLIMVNRSTKHFFCFTGVPDAGKSTFINMMCDLFLSPEAYESFNPSDMADRFFLSRLINKQLVFCPDMKSDPLNSSQTALLKELGGNDRINAVFKNQNGSVSFINTAVIIFCSNYPVLSHRNDTGFRNRKITVPFRNPVPPEKRMDKSELYRLIIPEKSAIAHKMIMAYKRLEQNGFHFSGEGLGYEDFIPIAEDESAKINSVARFCSKYCEFTGQENDMVFTEDLFLRYQQFSSEEYGYTFQSSSQFSRVFGQLNPSLSTRKIRRFCDSNPQNCYCGIKIINC